MNRMLLPSLCRSNSKNICRAAALLAMISVLPFNLDAAPKLTFRGNNIDVLDETPERSTGLDKIYVLYEVRNVDLIYESASPYNVKIYRYSNLGGGFAEEINNIKIDGNNVIVSGFEGNMGYIVEDGSERYYFWIVNYSPFRFRVQSISESPEHDCDATILNFEGSAEPIHYYAINGQQKVLDRGITVEYDTQEWNEELKEFSRVAGMKNFESLSSIIRIIPPAYCSTSFRISGDKFLKRWNWAVEAESDVISPFSIMVKTEAIQYGRDSGVEEQSRRGTKRRYKSRGEDEDTSGDSVKDDDSTGGSNEINSDSDGLGGSAPAEIEFNAYVTEGVLHHEWQLSKDPEFEEVDYRFNQQNITYTFTEEGTFYMRYVGSNSDGSCEDVGDTYTISIGASELLCPNAFSPDGDGVNDEWKISYRSLLDFECWIFDRFGAQLFHTTDPQKGWDGMRGGKVVPSGVYYYVIQATGADGKKYKKSGDINILRHRSVTNEGSGREE